MSTAADTLVRARGLHTRFGEQAVHEGVDLTVRRGEIMGIVGGSGSGKTVLMRQLMMLQTPDRGEIEILGRRVDASAADLHALRRRMGAMFQNGALFTGLTVLENVALPLTEHTRLPPGFRRDLARLKIALAGLPPNSAHLLPATLSGGMTKRAALARALALDPELLFLDEPTSGLDPVSAAAFDHLIVTLRDLLGLTVVLITHDPASLMRVADRAAFIGERRILAVAPPAELARSHHPRVRAYFAGPAAGATHE